MSSLVMMTSSQQRDMRTPTGHLIKHNDQDNLLLFKLSIGMRKKVNQNVVSSDLQRTHIIHPQICRYDSTPQQNL